MYVYDMQQSSRQWQCLTLTLKHFKAPILVFLKAIQAI